MSVIATTAYAQATDQPDSHDYDGILRDATVHAVIFIVLAAVTMRTAGGMIGKHINQLNPGKIILTFVISSIMGIGLVAPIIEAMPTTLTPTLTLLFLVNQIIVVFNSDRLYKDARTAVDKVAKNIPGNTQPAPTPQVYHKPESTPTATEAADTAAAAIADAVRARATEEANHDPTADDDDLPPGRS